MVRGGTKLWIWSYFKCPYADWLSVFITFIGCCIHAGIFESCSLVSSELVCSSWLSNKAAVLYTILDS
ncbi:hypothetical protein GJAV_G00120830 [Gymnothorax javanicus]|nr:hypothetical protein GJAV_G00120830 [Gymnothorax javanicus]